MREGLTMRKTTTFLLILVIVLGIIGCDGEITEVEEEKRAQRDRYYNLTEKTEEVIANTLNRYNGVGISIYISSQHLSDDISLAQGYKNKAARTKLQADNLFRIGSLTKSFTGIAILKLVKEDKIDPDAAVSNYLTKEHDYFDRITVRNLLNMSAGLKGHIDDNNQFLVSYLENSPEKYLSPSSLIDESLSITDELLFKPGTNFHYTNTNYVLLAMIIEEVTNKSYKDYIEEEIIEYFNLDNTYVADDLSIPENMAHGYYDSNQDGSKEDWTRVHPSIFWAAGDIVSTTQDICDWFEIIAKNPEIESLDDELLWQGQKLPGMDNQYYTAGFLYEEDRLIGGNGTVIGYHTDAWHRSDLDTTVVVFSNFLTSKEGDPTREVKNEVFSSLEKLLE